MPAKWKVFKNTREQMNEINSAPHGFLLYKKNGDISPAQDILVYNINNIEKYSHYLICEPALKGRYKNMIEQWQKTGQPIEYQEIDNKWYPIACPSWLEGTEYRFAKPKKTLVTKQEFFIIKDNKEVVEHGWCTQKFKSNSDKLGNFKLLLGETKEFEE